MGGDHPSELLLLLCLRTPLDVFHNLGEEIISSLDYSHGGYHQLVPLNSWGVLFMTRMLYSLHRRLTIHSFSCFSSLQFYTFINRFVTGIFSHTAPPPAIFISSV